MEINKLTIELSVVEGIEGYIITAQNGEKLFCYSLGLALTHLAAALTGKEQMVMVL